MFNKSFQSLQCSKTSSVFVWYSFKVLRCYFHLRWLYYEGYTYKIRSHTVPHTQYYCHCRTVQCGLPGELGNMTWNKCVKVVTYTQQRFCQNLQAQKLLHTQPNYLAYYPKCSVYQDFLDMYFFPTIKVIAKILGLILSIL